MSQPEASRYHPTGMAINGRRTKIIATWGPAAATDERLRHLLRAGVDVFRLNFSHANHDEISEVVPRIHALAAQEHRHVALLQNIQGPRIRTGLLPGGQPVELETDSIISIGAEGEGSTDEAHVTVT
jgi:pyruvate kinase